MTKEQQAEKIQHLANATKTYYQCTGHSKADRNEWACKEYKQELQAAGIEIPTDEELLVVGIFNGDGAQ